MYRMATPWQPSPQKLRDDLVVFAVGDIHGSWGLLRELRRFIQAEVDSHPGYRYKIVYLGDYIDRGPKSKEALEFLVGQSQQDQVESVFLCGNHDHFLISLLELKDRDDQSLLADLIYTWLANGGAEAVRNFNVALDDECLRDLRKLRDRISKSLGPEIREFLNRLQLIHREDNYLFVHAGIHPLMALETQSSAQFLWIREPFLNASGGWHHDFCVVHGHTPACPEVHPHRIGVDTGVYMSQALTAVQLRGDQLRFLTAARTAGGDWQNRLHFGSPAAYSVVGESRPSLDCYAHESGL